jgi:phosphoribosylamine--glycine ligase
MGSFSPSNEIDKEMMDKIYSRVLNPFMDGIKEEGMNYRGIIFVGIMIVKGDPYVLEFNVRFGDPETQSILARMENDIVDVMDSVIDEKLSETRLSWTDKTAMTVVLASGGYPASYQKGYEISGLDSLNEIKIIHGGTKSDDDKVLTNGGRVLNMVVLGDSIEDCRQKIYGQIDRVKFQDIYFRNDIGL